MTELPAFPIAVKISTTDYVPFVEGTYTFSRSRRPYSVHVAKASPKTKRQSIIVSFQGTTFEKNGKDKFKVDEAKAKNFFEFVVKKKKVLKTHIWIDYHGTFSEGPKGSEKETRPITFKEETAVFELATETINELMLASKCAIPSLSHVPLVNEDYFSSGSLNPAFAYYVPDFENRIQWNVSFLAGAKYEFFIVDETDFIEKVLPVLKDRKSHVAQEMLVSANKAFNDGEYEASLVLFESVFEAMIKEKVAAYYQEMPFASVDDREKRIANVLQRDIKSLIRDEYPKCSDAKWFCEGVPVFRKWEKLYEQRNAIVHRVQTKGRLSKKEALQAFQDFRAVFKYLFDIESGYR